MKKEKKFSNQEIIDAIIEKFGSVEKYADVIGILPASMYQRIDRQSGKFFHELKEHGIVIQKSGISQKNINYDSANNYQSAGDMKIGGETTKYLEMIGSLTFENNQLRNTLAQKERELEELKSKLNKAKD